MNPTAPILKVDGIRVHYGVIPALAEVSFEILPGQIVALIGANGAGKTTILRSISNLVPLSSGQIHFLGEPISGLPTHQIARRGISHVPEGRGIFLNLSVEENLDLGAWAAPNARSYREDLETVYELFPRLAERRKQNAGTLSGGEQQMLALGRAWMSQPRLLLLDEPSLGLAPQMIERIFELIQELNRRGVTLLLVEQNALQALQIAHEAIVLETGKIVMKGDARALSKTDEVRRAYLGGYL